MDISRKLLIGIICILGMLTISTMVSAQDLSSAEGFAIFGGIMCFLFIIIWFVIFILIAIWVYRDAEKRGSSGALWLIIVILLGLIGIIIWLIVRPPIGGKPTAQGTTAADSDRRCPNCGRNIPMDARACPYCAKKFEE